MADAVLKYNVRWIEQTFTSPSVTESLLSPERESGNITTNDYEAATRFFPGPKRRYHLLGAIAALPLAFALRKPSWANARVYFLMTTSSAAGVLVGHMMSISAHFRFVRSIENPAGFSQALDNIQKNMGGFSLPGPVIVRHGGKLVVGDDSEFPASNPATTSTNATTTNVAAPSTASSNIWEQIRAANSRTSRSSSWDAIRQGHERNRVGTGEDHDHGHGAGQRRYEDRAEEQAKFDALLEKERNIK